MTGKDKFLIEMEVSVFRSVDVVVVGGGPAGIGSAIAAARCGKKVVLIEQSAQLGGMGTLGNVSIFMDIGNCTGIYKEIIYENNLHEMVGKYKYPWGETIDKLAPQYDPFLLRYYFNCKLEKEGVEVLYHCSFVKTLIEDNKVVGVVINTREGLKIAEGTTIIDCTGDARVAIDAGVEYYAGRESDGLTQPMTLMFQMQNTGKPVNQPLPSGCYHYDSIPDLPQGRLLFWERNQNGTLLVNNTRVKGNGAKIEDINNAEKEALKQVFSVANYLQRNGYENYILSHVAPQTGVRQTNQIVGEYTLTEDDLINARKFTDVVAQTNYEIDIHSPEGKNGTDERALECYDIPYRCMVPKGMQGLLVSGRAISATHVAMSSARVQATCFALGQAAGVAAAISIDEKCVLAKIPIVNLHAILKEQGVDFS